MRHTTGDRSHDAAGEFVDKAPVAGPFERDGSVSGTSDGQGSAVSKNRMSSSSDVSKQQVEEMVLRLTIDEKSKLFDEIFAKVKTGLAEGPQIPVSNAVDTPSTEGTPSPRSTSIGMSTGSQRGAYQATVEDDMDESFDSSNRTHDSARGSLSNNDSMDSAASSVVSESVSSRVSSSRRPSALASGYPPESPHKSRPTVRFSDKGPVVLNGRHASTQPRQDVAAPIPETEAHVVALSAVDVKWGRLFDDKGEPTVRLGQFIRGIANYLIAEYSPANSLVITPDKLYAFYSRYKLESESIPFQHMFEPRPRKDYASLEWLYQDLHCAYHLVQGRPNSTPRVPALTPAGFEEWMVRQIQAFPDQEAERLNYIVAELPISADGPFQDGKAERLPKQLSRHLLPAAPRREICDAVMVAVHSWVKADSRSEEEELRHRYKSRDGHGRSSDGYSRSGDGYSRSGDGYSRSGDSYSKSSDRGSSRKDHPARFLPRANSEGAVRRSDPSPPPVGPSKSRSPTSGNRYRSSASSLNSPDDYGLSSPRITTASGAERRSREQEYRYYHGRAPGGDATPRSFGGGGSSRGRNLVIQTQPHEDGGATYDEYARTSPRASRTGEDGGAYRPGHSGGAG
ncbi:hypothetical protein AK830_g769 [Neonectria ditissima]|uniref:DUF7514 domain-containing protein n=1 Tax=Neonectria ditissima TaxID=78410 RepID=A0A0P7BPD6_9HYPO|nr:hypothetical protein AK830_g769 [Neonectria ditissima]